MALSIEMSAILYREDSPQQRYQYMLMLDEALRLTDLICFSGGNPIILYAFENGFMSKDDQTFWTNHSAELHGPPRSFQGAANISRFAKNHLSLEYSGKPLEADLIIRVGVRRHGIALPAYYFVGAIREIMAVELVVKRGQQP